MKLTHLRTNHVETPLGLYLDHPVFSWVAENTADRKQAAAQIVVKTPDGATVYDSGKQEGLSSLGVEVPMELLPRTRYQWTVTVWGDGGDSATASSWFETGKQSEPWQAQWIAADFPDNEVQPLLVKEFTLPEQVENFALERTYRYGRVHLRLYRRQDARAAESLPEKGRTRE